MSKKIIKFAAEVQIIPDTLISVDKYGNKTYSGVVLWEDSYGKSWRSTRYITIAKGEDENFIKKIKENFINIFR